MIKVMWLLKRAPHLTLDECRDLWLTRHAPDIIAEESPYLKRHIVDVRREDVDGLSGKPDQEPEWDGIAEQWFETEADYNAVYGRALRSPRNDTLADTSAPYPAGLGKAIRQSPEE